MTKKYKIIVTTTIMSLLMVACGCEGKEQNTSENKTTEEIIEETTEDLDGIKAELDEIYASIESMKDDCDDITQRITNLWTIYIDYDFEALFNKEYKIDNLMRITGSELSKHHTQRTRVIGYQESIKDDLKAITVDDEELSKYKSALEDLYVCVNAWSEKIVDKPVGYNKITFNNAYSEFDTEYSSLNGKVSLYK